MLHKRTLAQLITFFIVVSLVGLPSSAATTATPPPLGTADSFAVLAATAVTNVPASAITGDVGLSPATGSNYTGLTAPEVTGTIYAVDATGPAGSVINPALLTTAKTDLVTAYNALASQACTTTYPGIKELAGENLVPGVYCADNFTLSGILTLNGADTDVWVFKSAATLIVSGVTDVVLSTGGTPCSVWWQIGSSATLGTNTSLAGNILALTSISLATGAHLDGRALARNGAVTMDQNSIVIPICVLDVPVVTTEIHDADHVEMTSAPVDTVVHDMAMISGTLGITPTGTVTFTVYQNQTCTAPGTFAGAIPLAARTSGVSVADPSDTATLTGAGLSYLAHYSGDHNYDPADGPCEVLRPMAVPNITTQIHNAVHAEVTSAPIGTVVHDMARVTGAVGVPTGVVSFTVYSNQACTGGGTFAGATPLNAAGVADPSNTAILTSAGLSYKARYSGDAIYIAAEGPCEVLRALTLAPAITTEIHDATHTEVLFASVGTVVHDMASVTGAAGAPTGIVSFTVYHNPTCAGAGTSAGTVPLNAAGVADPSDTATLTSAGLSYKVRYSGDHNYNAITGPCEVLVALGMPHVTTQIHNATTHTEVLFAPVGTVVHDMARVTGTLGIPTGVVNFTVYPNQTCTGAGTSAGAVPLDAVGVADPSNTATLTSAGLSYLAHYSGDATYDPADGPCEGLAALTIMPAITTEIHDANHLAMLFAPIGTVVHDMARVTGAVGVPTGVVSFTVYTNRTCAGAGTSAGTVPLNAAGVADPSNTAILTSAGLSYLAHYNGDANYMAAAGPCEVLVALAVPAITTEIHDAAHAEVLFAPVGTVVHDMASVTGTVGVPTGIVSFTVYHNPICAGVGTSAGAVPLNAAGVADPSDTATLTSAGLSYKAHYSGDAIYIAATGPCEVLVALGMPHVTTQIHNAATHAEVLFAPVGTVVHDMARVTGTLGIPTGVVNFTVYANQTCTGAGTPAGAIPLDAAGVADPSNTATLTSAGLSYLAHYSGDATYDPADGPCEGLAPIPTAVELLYFQANQLSGQQVQLQWATALEVDNFGFNLYRATVNDRTRASLVHFEAAVRQGSGSGATYRYVDTVPYAGRWWYWLSDVDTYGRETFHNTLINITVEPNNGLPYRIYLPFVSSP